MPNAKLGLAVALAVIALLSPCFSQQAVPDWQTKAGGKMSFEVASIRPDNGPFVPPYFALDASDSFSSSGPGNAFKADFPLAVYIEFAYKLWLSKQQRDAVFAHQPDWLTSRRFVIEARAPNDHPTKDQMRLMMQALLAERFHLVIHTEKRESTVLALSLIKPGKLGSSLRPHAEGPSCDVVVPPPAKDAKPEATIFPPICNAFMGRLTSTGPGLIGARAAPINLIGNFIGSMSGVEYTIIDQTGLSGTYDFKLEFTPDKSAPLPDGAGPVADTPGTPFGEAMKEQLGLQLKPAKAMVETPVIDHVELPSEN